MYKVVILAIIQGITEFLPISSSAHLIIVRAIMDLNLSNDVALTLDVALHLGTMLSIGIFFIKDLIRLVSSGFTKRNNDTKLFWYLIIATIPAALIGVLFEDIINNLIRDNKILIGIALIIMGIIIYLVDKKKEEVKELYDITLMDALKIGVSQLFALIPGISRSGITITTSRLLGINRVDSTKFSFYLSFPIILGSAIYTLLFKGINIDYKILIVGIFTSFITGMWTIKFLLNYINNHDYKIFMIYRIIIGLIMIIFL